MKPNTKFHVHKAILAQHRKLFLAQIDADRERKMIELPHDAPVSVEDVRLLFAVLYDQSSSFS